METIEQKHRRIFGKQKLSKYLAEINSILNIEIEANDLLSIEETDFVLSNQYKLQTYLKETILFEQKNDLKETIINNISKNSYGYFIFISDVLECGAIRIDSIEIFNFNYCDVGSGLISLLSEDSSETIVLDFYEDHNIKYIEIELSRRVF